MEALKTKAELFLDKDIKVMIKDIDKNWYFADLLFVGEDTLRFICFGPDQRSGQTYTKYWQLIVNIEEFVEGGK